jgi:hypothetical protein
LSISKDGGTLAGDIGLTLVKETTGQLATTTAARTEVLEAARANLSVDILTTIDAHNGSSDSA